MKLVLIALTLISCGIATGTQFRPKQIRVCLQFIEVSHSTLTEILDTNDKSGQTLHDKAFALTKNGQAKLVETCMLICRSGEKATLETIREEIYPTEYEPPTFACGGSNTPLYATNPKLREPTAFDTRNTGVTFNVEALLNSNGAIELRLNPEMVTRLRLENWMEHQDQWGDGSMRMPIFETIRFSTSICVEPGKLALVSVLTPKASAPIPAVSRKILAFVRADVLPDP